MEVQVPTPSSLYTADDQNNLKLLLEAFGSVVSLQDIASAYCKTGRNLNSTAEILCDMQCSIAGTSSSKSQESVENTNISSSGCQSNTISENGHIAKTKLKKFSASMGTVSDVIGKDYIKPRSESNGLSEKLKPMKINSDDFPASEIWDEKKELIVTPQREPMDNDLEEFLYKMLGKGFQLEKSVIQDVIGQCGYNMSRSIDKLLDLSAATLEKSDDVIGIAAGNSMNNSIDLESMSRRAQSPLIDSSRRLNTDVGNGNELILPRAAKKTENIQRDVLEALFSVPDRFEEKQEPTRPIRPVRQSPYGQVVSKPLEETLIEDFDFITRQSVNGRNGEADDSSYDDLRKAVMEYWVLMKAYYKASVDAYTKKDYENAQKLLEEGTFFMRKARETDEKSTRKLIENSGDEEVMVINMHYLDPKEALRLTKLQLTSLSGLPSVHYLKFAVEINGEDSKDGRRRKRLIIKLLEKEGIPWTEEGDGWVISIRSDEIDPKKLSFFAK